MLSYLLLYSIGFQFDYVFDWTILKYQQSQLANAPARALVSVGFNPVDCWFAMYLIMSCSFQGPGVGTSSGMPPAIVGADRQTGSFCVSSSYRMISFYLNLFCSWWRVPLEDFLLLTWECCRFIYLVDDFLKY